MVIRPVRGGSAVRLLAGLLAAAVVVAACGDAADDAVGTDEPTGATTADGGVPGTAPSDDPGSSSTAAPGSSAAGDTAPASTTSPAGGGESPPSTTTTALPPAPGGVGAFAGFYLRPAESASIVLDVHSQSGAEPAGDTLAHVRSVLADVSGKPVELSGGAIAGSGRSWTAAEIRALADSIGLGQSRDRAVLELLFLKGDFAQSDTVLGVAVRSDVAAVFSDKVADAAGVLESPTRIETAVTTHEMGHLLGLVDLALSTGREDPDHPGHSRNEGSVMYWAVESTLVGSLLDGGPPTTFDADDRADLATIRNG